MQSRNKDAMICPGKAGRVSSRGLVDRICLDLYASTDDSSLSQY